MDKLSDVDVERFWSHVDRSGDCWTWTRSTSNGYGSFRVNRRTYKAHRIAWLLTNGDPGPWHVLHSCDVRACCRPEHLWLGTNADNTADRVAKGRTRTWATERSRLGSAHPRAKLTEEIVIEARRQYASGERTSVALAAEHGVAQATMHAALTGKTWSHLQAL